jgi:ABC-type lipoprotein export system ATPase subunit
MFVSESAAPLVTTGLTHSYPRADGPVLTEVGVSFSWSELTAIWGPSGSGKSTFLSLLGLLMAPSEGKVIVMGTDAWSSPRQARALRASSYAWVLQNSACLEARSALDNVMVGVRSGGAARDQARDVATEALHLVGLEHRLFARASELSGGELQRMTVARAFAQGRPIVLADEPTGQLDRQSSQTVATALRSLAASGCAVVVATHDQALAAGCDRVLAVADGRIGS